MDIHADEQAAAQEDKKKKKKKLQPRRKTLEQLGVCARSAERWEKNEALGFPPTTFINGRKYDDPDEIDAFIASRKAARG
jgi:hypothetical protein